MSCFEELPWSQYTWCECQMQVDKLYWCESHQRLIKLLQMSRALSVLRNILFICMNLVCSNVPVEQLVLRWMINNSVVGLKTGYNVYCTINALLITLYKGVCEMLQDNKAMTKSMFTTGLHLVFKLYSSKSVLECARCFWYPLVLSTCIIKVKI